MKETHQTQLFSVDGRLDLFLKLEEKTFPALTYFLPKALELVSKSVIMIQKHFLFRYLKLQGQKNQEIRSAISSLEGRIKGHLNKNYQSSPKRCNS